MADVTLRDVTKAWGGFTAVKRQSLEIRDGEFMVLLGPSGCGKTTTMRMIAGLEEPSSGDILIGGRRVNDLPPRERDIAMVFQSYGLYPHMNVGDNIGYPLKLRGIRREERARLVREAARRSIWQIFCIASCANCRAGSGSAWRWPAPSCAARPCS